MRSPSRKAKKFTVACPAISLPRGRGRADKTKLNVYYYEHLVGVPWSEIRPLVATAFRHVQREGFRLLRDDFIARNKRFTSELVLTASCTSCWYGFHVGYRSRVHVGAKHTEPKRTTYPKFKDMPVFWIRDWKEHLVGLIAHELWHRWQPGSGKNAEFMCELVESDAIDTYRKEQGYTFTPPETETNETETNETNETEISQPELVTA